MTMQEIAATIERGGGNRQARVFVDEYSNAADIRFKKDD